MEIVDNIKSKICKRCGSSFPPYYHLQVYCSPKCRLLFNRVRFRELHPYKYKVGERSDICIVCGKEFTTKNFTKKTCSEKCSRKHKNRKKYKNHRNRRNLTMVKCEICGFSIPEALEAHHYTPKDVIILCGSCHNIWHKLSDNKHSLREIVISTVSNHILNSQISLKKADLSPNHPQVEGLCTKSL